MQTKKSHLGLILILLAIAMFQFWVSPLSKTVKVKREELATLDTEVQKIVGETTKTKPNVVLTEVERNLLKESVPQGFDQEKLLRTLNQIATNNLTQLNSIGFNKTIADSNNQIQAVQLGISGTTNRANFLNFVKDLESSNRTFIVKSISVNYSTVEGLEQASFSLNVEAYFS